MSENTTVSITEAVNSNTIEFGAGRYSNIARELFRDSQRVLKISEQQAARLAKSYVAELGRTNMVVQKVGIGKFDKDGYTTLRESSKAKDVKVTNPVRIAQIVVKLDEIRKLGVSSYNQIPLEPELVDWLNE
jgi:hypothetical protein